MTNRSKPRERQFLTARVVGSKQLSPNFVRVTIGGESLRDFTPLGFDQWFRLFLPTEKGLRLPTWSNGAWFAQYMVMPKDIRPIGRNYTVREYRHTGLFSDGPEIDIDFAMHEDAFGELGVASAWAKAASPGAELGLLDEGVTYQPTADAEWQLLMGDETALPAIMGILTSAPRDLRAKVYIEIAHADDAQQVDAPAGAEIHWLVRADHRALDAVRAATLPSGPGYAFVAGGQKLAAGVRRHLVSDRKMPKDSVTFTGYWR